jgi:hypothetical protein
MNCRLLYKPANALSRIDLKANSLTALAKYTVEKGNAD